MSQPATIEREHYAKVVGRQIAAILWEELEDEALPVLRLNGWDLASGFPTENALLGNGNELAAMRAIEQGCHLNEVGMMSKFAMGAIKVHRLGPDWASENESAKACGTSREA